MNGFQSSVAFGGRAICRLFGDIMRHCRPGSLLSSSLITSFDYDFLTLSWLGFFCEDTCTCLFSGVGYSIRLVLVPFSFPFTQTTILVPPPSCNIIPNQPLHLNSERNPLIHGKQCLEPSLSLASWPPAPPPKQTSPPTASNTSAASKQARGYSPSRWN